METNKKISFGFNKLVKKPLRTQPREENKIELVECLEGQSIKIKDFVEVIKEPLVIPIKDNKKNLFDRVKEAKLKREIKAEKEDDRPDSELTLEEQAAKALINDAKNRLENNKVSNSKITVLPIKNDKITIDGESESTLEDYENVPISDYGMAMLRGMGWREGMGIGKDPSKTVATSTPELRPKGLGLGATRIVKPEDPVCDKDGNALILKKGAYAKIIAGSHKGNYCEVQGLDDEAGRVIVRTSLKGEILTLNEFLIVPVTNKEYSQGAKVLNNAKYEEYKEKSERNLEAQRKTKNKNLEKESYDDSEKKRSSKIESNKYPKGSTSSHKVVSENENNLSSEGKFQERGKYKNRSESDDEKKKYEKKSESHRNKYRDEHSSTSESDEKYKKSRDYQRDSSHSDSGSRKNKRKEKNSKKDCSRDRSRSRKEKQKSYKKSERSRDRSTYDDYKSRESSKKHKSKSRHRRRSSSSSSSSGRDHRSSRR